MILFCFIVYMWKKLFKKEAFYHLKKKKKEPLVHTKDPSGRKMSKIKSKLFLSLKLEGMWVKKKKKMIGYSSVCLQASLLSATCATFIRTLEECMTLANHSLTPDFRPPERVISPSLANQKPVI